MLEFAVLIACPLLFAIGAMTDVVSFRIPNWVSLGLAAAFFVAAFASGMPLSTLGWHLAIALAALVFGFTLFAFNLIGGGDAKLFAAGALWAGPYQIIMYCLVFALVGGAVAVALIVLRRLPLPAGVHRVDFLRKLLHPKAGMPYGLALGIGALLVLPSTPLFIQALTS